MYPTVNKGRDGLRDDLSDNELRQQDLVFGTESGTVGDGSGILNADLQAVIDAWPGLSSAVQAEVMAIIEASRA